MKISTFYFGPGSPKKRFLRFFQTIFTKKWAGNTGITSETTIPESRVRRRKPRDEWDAASARKRQDLVPDFMIHCRAGTAGQLRDVLIGVKTLHVGTRTYPRSASVRLTLGSRVSVVSLVIPYSSPFFVKKFRKNRKNQFIGLPGPK